MTVPVEEILAAKRADPDASQKAIARKLGTSPGTVWRVLHGLIRPPRGKLVPKPYRRVSYAGYAGGREWNDRGRG